MGAAINTVITSDDHPAVDDSIYEPTVDDSIVDKSDTAVNALNPAVSSGDFKRVVELMQQRALSNEEKYYLLTNHFFPNRAYKFPSYEYGKQKRSFQHNWLSRYNGLVYSESGKGGYCKYCVLFGRAAYSMQSFSGILINRPLTTNLQKASQKLREHFEGIGSDTAKKYHLEAVEKAETFKKVMESKQMPVDRQLSKIQALTVAKNKEKLKSIVETIIFCGRQGIALRGHCDNHTCQGDVPHANPGNFIALLNFRIKSGDTVLADHLESCGGNAFYTSKTIQNQLIAVCGKIIQSSILQEIQAAPLFSIMADEATDASNKEQLAVCIRYVNSSTLKIEEHFLGFSECETHVSGQAIAAHILQLLETWQLPASQLRGQTYDGAGAMAGKTKGAAARITELYPKALYTHCSSHVLNLCIVTCCSIPAIRNTMDVADCVHHFFDNSPKRQFALEKWITEVLPDSEKRRKLKSVCKTRWVERHEAFEVFFDLFLPLVCCLEELKDASCDEWNQDTRKDAQSHFLVLTRFSFIFALTVTKEVLGYTKALSVKLQGRYVDVVKALTEINVVKRTLQSARSGVGQFHRRVYRSAVELAKVVNVDESVPRTTGQQQHRCNVPYASVSEYFQRQLTIPALDHLISEINDRFTKSLSDKICQIKVLLPSTLAECTCVLTSADIPNLLSLYHDDLPSLTSLDTELHCWGMK